MTRERFDLFVAGRAAPSAAARTAARVLLDTYLPETYDLHVVDVLEDPTAAERERVLATPTLIRHHPDTPSRVIGDLSDPERVAHALGLSRPMTGPQEHM
jgi:circadian clock protein KaiB